MAPRRDGKVNRNSAAARIDKDLGAKLRAFRLAAPQSSELGEYGLFALAIARVRDLQKPHGRLDSGAVCKVLKLDPMEFLADHFHRR